MLTEHFNNLSESEAEALSVLAEECAEVIQIISKIQRHGIDSAYKEISNRDNLSQELADVLVAALRVHKLGLLLDREGIEEKIYNKLAKNSYLHHAPEVTLEDFIVGNEKSAGE